MHWVRVGGGPLCDEGDVSPARPARAPAGLVVNAAAVRAIRERSGLTVTDLAELVGTSQAHMSNIELGVRAPSPDLTVRLAAVLKVDVLAIIEQPSSVLDRVERLREVCAAAVELRAGVDTGEVPGGAVDRFDRAVAGLVDTEDDDLGLG